MNTRPCSPCFVISIALLFVACATPGTGRDARPPPTTFDPATATVQGVNVREVVLREAPLLHAPQLDSTTPATTSLIGLGLSMAARALTDAENRDRVARVEEARRTLGPAGDASGFRDSFAHSLREVVDRSKWLEVMRYERATDYEPVAAFDTRSAPFVGFFTDVKLGIDARTLAVITTVIHVPQSQLYPNYTKIFVSYEELPKAGDLTENLEAWAAQDAALLKEALETARRELVSLLDSEFLNAQGNDTTAPWAKFRFTGLLSRSSQKGRLISKDDRRFAAMARDGTVFSGPTGALIAMDVSPPPETSSPTADRERRSRRR